jgi:hypothetical protein
MPTINQLPVVSQLSSGDQIPVYNTVNGDARRASLNTLLGFFEQTFASPDVAVNLYTPTTGFSIAVPTPVSQQQWILLQPVSTLATGTVTLPLNTGTPDGTEILITTTQQITALTIGLNGASAVFGLPTMLQAGSGVRFRWYQATNSWYSIADLARFGYSTGGAVVQATSKATAVTLDRATGTITMNNAALAAATTVTFTLNSAAIEANDLVVLNHVSGGTAGAYTLNAQCLAGQAQINVRNVTAGSLSEAIVLRYAVIKSSNA